MRALILTKSRMNAHGVSGVCTTAYDFDTSQIVRFVSNREGAPIANPYNKLYECLDVVNVQSIQSCPIGPQTENVLVDQTSFVRLYKYQDNLQELLHNISIKQSSQFRFMFHGSQAVKYKLQSVNEYDHSLEIKKVSQLILNRNDWGATSAAFLSSTQYGIQQFKYYRVTDPQYEINNNGLPEKVIGNAYIIVSVPHSPYEKDGYYYKFIAAIYSTN